MFPSFATPCIFTRHAHALLAPMLILILSAFTLIPPESGSAQLIEQAPTATGVAFLRSSGTLIVRGEGFTPGGRVQVTILDHQENSLHAPIWTSTAIGGFIVSQPGFDAPGTFVLVLQLEGSATYGPNGSQDPASGYQANGLLDAGNVIVRVYDETANTWSAIAVSNPDSALASSPGQDDHSAGTRTCTDVLLCQEYS